MRNITPFLWFDDKAEEAVNFHVSAFRNSRIVGVARYGEAGAKASGRARGSVMTVAFEPEGQPFVALNGGHAGVASDEKIDIAGLKKAYGQRYPETDIDRAKKSA